MPSTRHKNREQAGRGLDGSTLERDSLTGQVHAVLDAARESILAVGWRRTTLTDVARRAGVSRMTLYRRWPDMTGLLGDLLTREWTAAMATVTEAPHPEESLLDQVQQAVVEVARAIRDDELFAKIIHVDPELLLPYLLHRRGRSQELVLAMLEPLLREGQRRSEIRPGDPVLMARTLLLTAQGFTLSVQTMTDGGSEMVPEEIVKQPSRRAAAPTTVADFETELGTLVHRYLAP